MREQTNVQSLQEEELNRAKEQVAKETEQLKNTLNARQLEMARLSALIENYVPCSNKSFQLGIMDTYVSTFFSVSSTCAT